MGEGRHVAALPESLIKQKTVKTTIQVPQSAKKTLTTAWEIVQAHPYPDHDRNGWRNHGGLIPRGSRMPREFTACLLRADHAAQPLENSRQDHAGFDGNPGTFAIRGRDLGEVSAKSRVYPGDVEPFWSFNVRGSESPTPGEREWLKEHVSPALSAFVAEHAAALESAAIDGFERACNRTLADLAEQLANMEADARAAVAFLRNR